MSDKVVAYCMVLGAILIIMPILFKMVEEFTKPNAPTVIERHFNSEGVEVKRIYERGGE